MDRHEAGHIEALRRRFPQGTRVVLVKMDDRAAPPEGTCGTVISVDDLGTVHVAWDDGSTLGAVIGEDIIRKVGS